eukprot:scaffold15918_cov73-Phaeocystis_antarctica.AAC.2
MLHARNKPLEWLGPRTVVWCSEPASGKSDVFSAYPSARDSCGAVAAGGNGATFTGGGYPGIGSWCTASTEMSALRSSRHGGADGLYTPGWLLEGSDRLRRPERLWLVDVDKHRAADKLFILRPSGWPFGTVQSRAELEATPSRIRGTVAVSSERVLEGAETLPQGIEGTAAHEAQKALVHAFARAQPARGRRRYDQGQA